MDTQNQKSKYYKDIKDSAASCIYSYPILHLSNETLHIQSKHIVSGEYGLCWWYILNILFIKNKT